MRRLILASRSPRRSAILSDHLTNYALEVRPSNVTEPPPSIDADPVEYSKMLARIKANTVFAQIKDELKPDDVVLGADTVVYCNNQIIGQPNDDEHACEILQMMAGRAQSVITGVAMLFVDGREICFAESTELFMREMTDLEIKSYVASGESHGKAGAYAIQESADAFVKITAGSFLNCVGLPIERVLKELPI